MIFKSSLRGRPGSLAVCGIALLGSVMVCGISEAATAPAYPDLLKQALTSAPRLAESQANIDAALGDARQAKAWRNPSLGIDAENFNSERGSPTYDGRQTTYSLSQPFELGGKRQARSSAAQAQVRVAQAGGRQTQADFAAELASAYADAEAAQARTVIYSDDLKRAEQDLTAAQALTDAGKEASIRVAQAKASLASASALVEASKAETVAALARLSALTGSAETYTEVTPALLTANQGQLAIPAFNIARSPVVEAARAERDVAMAQVRVEQAKAIPDLDLSIGLRQFPGRSQNALVAGVAVPLPLFDRNRGAVAAAEARRTAADARLRSTEAVVTADQRTASAQASASDLRLKAATESRDYAAEAYRLARIGYEAGKTPLLELLATRRAFADAEISLVNTRLDRARAVIALARASGQLAFGEP